MHPRTNRSQESSLPNCKERNAQCNGALSLGEVGYHWAVVLRAEPVQIVTRDALLAMRFWVNTLSTALVADQTSPLKRPAERPR